MKTITSNPFDSKVLKSTEPLLADFFTEACAPCRQWAPVLEELRLRLCPGGAPVFGGGARRRATAPQASVSFVCFCRRASLRLRASGRLSQPVKPRSIGLQGVKKHPFRPLADRIGQRPPRSGPKVILIFQRVMEARRQPGPQRHQFPVGRNRNKEGHLRRREYDLRQPTRILPRAHRVILLVRPT